jgi:hypothetical protein
MLTLGVQFVKYVLHVAGLRRAILCRRRDRPRFGAGHLPWPWSPGSGSERNRGHCRQHDDGQRNTRRQPVPHGTPFGCVLRLRDEPVRLRASCALARTMSGSRGSAGRSSPQGRSRRVRGLLMRMRFMSWPVAVSEGRLRVVPAVFGPCAVWAPTAPRTPGRPSHGPSASARSRSPGDRRTPGLPAGRTLRRRTRGRLRQWPCEPDPHRAYPSPGAPTRTGRLPRPRWYWHGASLVAFSAP